MNAEHLKLEQKDRMLYWTNLSGKVELGEAKEISEKIKDLITSTTIEQVIVDNRQVSGHWNQEVDHVWIDLMRFMPQHVKKTATLCHDVIIKLELNYLSSKAGTTESVRAFTAEELDQMLEFLEVSKVEL